MAWTTVPMPGSPYLCAGECHHPDCADHRKTAVSPCIGCTRPLGYGTPWVTHEGKPWHFACLDQQVNR